VLEDRDPYDGIREAKERYGGLDLPAVLSGMLVGLAMLVILAGLAMAATVVIPYLTGVAIDAIGRHDRGELELAAGLVARRRRLTFEHERLEVGTRGVDGSGQAGRAGSDDDDLAGRQLSGGDVLGQAGCFQFDVI